jgi:16S rRNA (guanine966-N2)-methyltransferase
MPKPKRRVADELVESTELRIVGGRHRGRKLKYEPFRTGDDPVTRPMKHRLREAIFNLVGVEAEGRHAIDLFAGTGALGLEALSRGAAHATFIERHVPTARVIEENIRTLGLEAQATLLVTSAFLWAKRLEQSAERGDKPAPSPSARSLPDAAIPWLAFCSPPYAFFVEREAEMLELLATVVERSPAGSMVVVEADGRFDFAKLETLGKRDSLRWDVRTYAPAVVGVWRDSSSQPAEVESG